MTIALLQRTGKEIEPHPKITFQSGIRTALITCA